MLYDTIRRALFCLDPERAHRLTLATLSAMGPTIVQALLGRRVPDCPRTVMGLEFRNPVGLAAGLDKDGDHIAALGALGFGFVEVGTVTPRPQPGNPRPRLFRLPEAHALINRMGFNNKGVEHLTAQVRRARLAGVLGINIGRNAATPPERAVDDYVLGLRAVYGLAGYVAVNISSPNTPGLRDLQYGQALDQLLGALKETQRELADRHRRYVPLAVKIAPDISDHDLPRIAESFVRHGIDGVIATNTTASRNGVEGLPRAAEAGGLSGAPLARRAAEVVTILARRLEGSIPVIAAGGIMSAADALERLSAGASLVQLYTGLVYRGPGLVREIAQAVARLEATAGPAPAP